MSSEVLLQFGEGEATEADVPVPDRLLPKRKSQWLVSRLKLSQKIGLLLFLNQKNLLSPGGEQRLLYLQQKASCEAIIAGVKFAEKLHKTMKLQLDFKHQMNELNRRPQSKRFRVREKSRIGVGYRDKGTLPELQLHIRLEAEKSDFIHVSQLDERVIVSAQRVCPACLVGGEWLSLSDLAESLSSDPAGLIELLLLLTPV